MSTFDGIIREITGISVDRFDGKNLYSSAFFLSHCHADHMKGLLAVGFQEKLISENRFLYLSSLSAIILRKLVPNISTQIKELPLEQISSISVENNNISVTCIPAGHCPGSVMFLFETKQVNILCTGDFRIDPEDITKFKCFYDTFGKVKPINTIYLDTTFFMKSYSFLPTREESLSELCKIISKWISLNPENCIKLDVRAKYGYEYVFKEIYENFKMPVHVDEEKYSFYSIIPELEYCVTKDGSKTQIHNCRFDQKDICDDSNKDKMRIIKLSALRWRDEDLVSGISQIDNDGIFYVCYSTHASYEEGLALINLLKPKNIHICVDWLNDPDASATIKKLVENETKKVNNIAGSNTVESPKLFNVVHPEKGNSSRQNEIFIESPRNKIARTDSILDSPPR
ncbi:unnamed protein product [Ceutorhynchus assimilis]|uniref:Protein artemis n=1 Tax=Ceutorhynchus assimilis TaxID=467358 RepID=A0A9N9MD62_9CUCU|nr:unnamed protein product [Ceutorhynchus assimilis]